MKIRLVVYIACLVAASVAGSADTYSYVVPTSEDQPTVHLETRSKRASVKTVTIPASTKLKLKATKIRRNWWAQQTYLEGAANVSYGNQVESGDLIALQELERNGRAEVLMVVVTGDATVRFVQKAE